MLITEPVTKPITAAVMPICLLSDIRNKIPIKLLMAATSIGTVKYLCEASTETNKLIRKLRGKSTEDIIRRSFSEFSWIIVYFEKSE